jgi:hypothetical protein
VPQPSRRTHNDAPDDTLVDAAHAVDDCAAAEGWRQADRLWHLRYSPAAGWIVVDAGEVHGHPLRALQDTWAPTSVHAVAYTAEVQATPGGRLWEVASSVELRQTLIMNRSGVTAVVLRRRGGGAVPVRDGAPRGGVVDALRCYLAAPYYDDVPAPAVVWRRRAARWAIDAAVDSLASLRGGNPVEQRTIACVMVELLERLAGVDDGSGGGYLGDASDLLGGLPGDGDTWDDVREAGVDVDGDELDDTWYDDAALAGLLSPSDRTLAELAATARALVDDGPQGGGDAVGLTVRLDAALARLGVAG